MAADKLRFPPAPSNKITWCDIKLFLWNAGAAFSLGMAIYYNHKDNTPESTWWNVMAFGLLMLARTEVPRG